MGFIFSKFIIFFSKFDFILQFHRFRRPAPTNDPVEHKVIVSGKIQRGFELAFENIRNAHALFSNKFEIFSTSETHMGKIKEEKFANLLNNTECLREILSDSVLDF